MVADADKLNLYLDLDGTILDISERYYRLYYDIITSLNKEPMAKEHYWQMKKEKVEEEHIIGMSDADLFNRYESERQKNIESLKYLKYDRPISGAIETLKDLANSHRIVLVTVRKLRHNLYRELKGLGIRSLFSEVLISRKDEQHRKTKAELVRTDSEFEKGNSVIIGDTELDIVAGKYLGITTVAVLSGIRTKDILLVDRPDYVIESIKYLSDVIKSITLSNR